MHQAYPMKPLENRVLKQISVRYPDGRTHGRTETTLESEHAHAKRQQETNLKRLEQQLEQNDKEKDNLLTFVRRNTLTVNESTIAEDLSKLDKQKNDLLEAKIREETELNKRTHTVNAKAQIKAYVENLREDLDTGDPIKIREVLKAFCNHITAEKDKHATVHYSIPMPPEIGDSTWHRNHTSAEQPIPAFGQSSPSINRGDPYTNRHPVGSRKAVELLESQ